MAKRTAGAAAEAPEDDRVTLAGGGDNLDELAALAQARKQPVRVRLQPAIYRGETQAGEVGNFRAWRGKVWMIEAQNASGVRRWAEAMDLLMSAIAVGKLPQAIRALEGVVGE